MTLRWHLLLFLLIFGFESSRVALKDGNIPPRNGDAAEVHNIAYSLAHGGGYSFNWNDEQWRKLWQDQNADGRFDFVVVRRGSYPTMFRPPLMPILVAPILKLFPHDSFSAWRIFDSAAFALAGCFLCDVALVHSGMIGLVALLVILMSDRVRPLYLPGWGTEGLAFVFLSLIVWLIANGGRLRLWKYNVYAGLAVGLLCLDRSIFVLTIPVVCLTLAFAQAKSRSPAIKSVLVILTVSMLIQIPWWVRNIAVSHRLMPLGTQGGVNLPDEYGDVALRYGGVWTGQGIRDALIPPSEESPPIPPGFSKDSFKKLWAPTDLRSAAMLYATVCTSLRSEIAVSDVGQRAAIAWMQANYTKIPWLMVRKALSLMEGRRRYLLIAALLSVIGVFGLPSLNRTSLFLALLITSYVLAVMLTHVVLLRFLLPILPPLYVGMAFGIATISLKLFSALSVKRTVPPLLFGEGGADETKECEKQQV